MSRSVLIYVQHLLGIGHLRRALVLARAMAAAGLRVTLVSGGEPLPDTESGDCRLVQLPPLRARDASFKTLVGADGEPADDALWTARAAILFAAFAEAQPDAIVIEAYPFGRRALRRELQPLIAAAYRRRPHPLLLCSLRDIVVPPEKKERYREIVVRVQADFDAVLVHGDPRLISLDESFPLTHEIADRIVYTGYVTAFDRAAEGYDRAGGEVLVSVGGGAIGGPLLRTALEARRRGCLASCGWRLIAGPNLPTADFEALRTKAPAGVVIERYRRDFGDLLRRCRVSVSLAGYNTVLDVITARAPAVLVPFAELAETEQTLRAERLAAHGIAEIVPAKKLSPERLAMAIERAVLTAPPPFDLDTDGARRSAAIVGDMIANRAIVNRAKALRHVVSLVDDESFGK
jgi:predicted glycosyltransferase